ncbi:hypothetical protein PYL56_08835 [Staphylococcus succinus]|uniref:hypothetical protein n=1 Tax=Staphylococcus succinus TaxID=61015 RepID=UPI00248084D8|nr:hypothetical protein [Staphylococcus succinus]MDH9161476.1 hypothetical protein [Staphylococcus succinus]
MKKLKKHLTKNNYEYIISKDEIHVFTNDLIVKIWKLNQEYAMLTFDNQEAASMDDFTEVYYKNNVEKTIKQLNKLVAQ